MADFKEGLQFVLANEGGYGNDAKDPGGETYKGVARKRNSAWPGWAIVDALKKQAGFPKNLDKSAELAAEVADFYKTVFWDKVQADRINDQRVANAVFDFAVNAGVGTSALLAQKVVGVAEDGIIGAATIAGINALAADEFLAKFSVSKIGHYIHCVEQRPSSKKYFYGWICRAMRAA